MTDSPEAPKIIFPCADYPIKVVGDNADDFYGFVVETVKGFDPHLDLEKVTMQDSRNGRFRSVRLKMTATGEEQLQALFEKLKASGRVHMVL
ncbi:MAG: YbeD family protein [Nitrincola lacisaponensis]|uniref:UPF0250 protein ADINL_0966 n=1 Tax=Nitrincola lacisaponensis TaxID=267850 RepID=A0A063Y3V6_9GAMM|nr:DUF493 family protein [Nitrincola lacisaponensis]KDE40374.1 putative lipoate regulatory protein YbeD [Nitrincola lacisaponensis]